MRLPGFDKVEVSRLPITPDHPVFAYSSLENTTAGADMHQAFEFGILLRGKKEMQFEGVSLRLSPGDVWLSPGCEVHGWRFLALDSTEVWVQFQPQFLPEDDPLGVPWLAMFAAPVSARPSAGTPKTRRQLLAIGREIAAEAESQLPMWEEGVRLGLLRALFVLHRQWQHKLSQHPDDAPAPTRLGQIMPAIELVHASPSRRVDLESAAAACGFQRSYFDGIFRDTMGLPFSRYELRTRLSYAARLLAIADSTVAAVAEETGFVDASHFHRRFAEVYGCTPATYRRRMVRG